VPMLPSRSYISPSMPSSASGPSLCSFVTSQLCGRYTRPFTVPLSMQGQAQLLLLISFVNYARTANRWLVLLKNGETAYNIIWAYFKPSAPIILCLYSEQPRCTECVSGEEQKAVQGQQYFQLECRYFSTVESSAKLRHSFAKFRGLRRIDSLEFSV